MTFRKPRLLAATLAAAAGLAVPMLTGQAAGATVLGGHDHDGLRAEHFSIRIVNDNPGQVIAAGPVHGFARDLESQTSATTGVFVFSRHTSVTVRHTDVSDTPLKLNRWTCTETGTAFGKWKFDGGTGRYSHAFGFGHFRFDISVKLARVHDKDHDRDWGRCDTNPKHQPELVLINVYAAGLASAGHDHDRR